MPKAENVDPAIFGSGPLDFTYDQSTQQNPILYEDKKNTPMGYDDIDDPLDVFLKI